MRAAEVTALHTDTRGRFRWRLTVACDAGVTIHTRRVELPTALGELPVSH